MGYQTIENKSIGEIIEKKSRFIGTLFPVSSEKEALDFLDQVRRENREARHNCYAYILRDRNIGRFSDDGEPSGTAGKPILEVLQREGLTDILCVVTRYFGGILLGTGGLARAYTDATKAALNNSTVLQMQEAVRGIIRIDYALYGKLLPLIQSLGGRENQNDFSDSVMVDFTIPLDKKARLEKDFTEITAGKGKIDWQEESFDSFR